MIRAFSLQWRARVSQYGLAVGLLPVVAMWAAVFGFEQERLGGLKEVDVVYPSASRLTSEATVPIAVPGFEIVVPMLARLPEPPVQRLPGVLCDPNGNVGFGASIAVHGNHLAVGAITDDTAGLEAGAVYMYDRDLETGAWQYRARILADADEKLAARTLGRRQALFGRRVALSNGVLAVMQGSVHYGGPTGDYPDNVYVFGLTGDHASDADGAAHGWRQEARLPTPKGGDGHGQDIAFLDSHTLLVAAPRAAPTHDDAPQGAVYVYQRRVVSKDRYHWVMLGELRPPLGAAADLYFAVSLEADNELIAVGMTTPDMGSRAETNRQWVLPLYRRPHPLAPPERWVELGGIPAPDDASGDFARGLAMRDSLLAVYGHSRRRNGSDVDAVPTVFVYRGPESGGFARDWVYEGELPKPPPDLNLAAVSAMATDGRWIVLGDGASGTSEVRPGLVCVYHRPPGQPWSLYQALGPFDPMNSGAFGNAVALFEGFLFVHGGDRLFHPDHGSVFIRRL